MSDVRNPDQFFHGTRYKFGHGKLLRPGAAPTNYSGYDDISEHVHFSTSREEALGWADMSSGGDNPRVYAVEPLGDIERDPNDVNGTASWRTKAPVRVLREARE
jgi:hypothetical protein